ncbi:NUDIX hydrolase domain-like protein [Fimicolochytrium jonesii]|uniref:NUDIX hydrolase domain-like protein n=1 Tax=Fimicolochytrium jonesii TaxID=1396493 RepID=UPI0022FDD200|nr:NUDIX hydrolase domain-like protein [Fimicolochytrium jonesii]KAI8823402.1 NUDIX hydrolase domain-like protein [Fimicolochytrium jonesii]
MTADTHTSATQVRVGVGVFVVRRRDNHILVGKRKGSHGHGTYQLPGGHLDPFESFEECAAREVWEEARLKLQNITYGTTTNDPMPKENKHYVTIFVTAECVDDEPLPEVCEPDKCDYWEFISFEELMTNRTPLFKPLESLAATRPSFRPETNSIDRH